MQLLDGDVAILGRAFTDDAEPDGAPQETGATYGDGINARLHLLMTTNDKYRICRKSNASPDGAPPPRKRPWLWRYPRITCSLRNHNRKYPLSSSGLVFQPARQVASKSPRQPLPAVRGGRGKPLPHPLLIILHSSVLPTKDEVKKRRTQLRTI